MANSEDALRVMRLFGDVEWARISLGVDPVDQLVRPPLIVWRYGSPSGELAALFEELVSAFRGEEEWVFDASAKNWMLVPRRIHDECERNPSLTSPEVMLTLKRGDQAFCRRSTRDAKELLERIESAGAGWSTM